MFKDCQIVLLEVAKASTTMIVSFVVDIYRANALGENMSNRSASFSTLAVFTVAILLSISMFANGVFMLINPALWYTQVPGVSTTGAFNQHFIRDIGILYMIIGGALLGGVLRREHSVMLWGTAALWLSGHAVFHVWEVLAGLCGPETLIRDFPAVILPALISVGLTVWAWRGKGYASHNCA